MTEPGVPCGGLVGELLRSAFVLPKEQMPDIFLTLLSQLEEHAEQAVPLDAAGAVLSDRQFKAQLSQMIPHLRAFGRSLTGDRDAADDLAQETLLKAWTARGQFQAGTSMRAWTFIILRNLFLSQMRRKRFTGAWNELVAERLLVAPAGQDRQIELADLRRALMLLPKSQRDAVLLVGAGGFAYEEVAAITHVAVGTVKSRVARARAALEQMMNEGELPARSAAGGRLQRSALDSLMDEVDKLAGR